jgi:hypothetical protein
VRRQDISYFNRLSEAELMALCIEREAGGEPREGRIAVGTVILERVDHRDWDGKTIHEVIMKPWQFSWTMPEAGKAYYEEAVEAAKDWPAHVLKNEALRECLDIAKGLLDETVPRDPDLARAHCLQYLNPQVAAGMKQEWLAAGMRVIRKIGRHAFFA